MSPAEDLTELYRSLSKPLEELVRIDVRRAPDPVVEDACQFAWDRLIRHRARVRRESALPWLVRTAVHEAFKLLGRERRFLSLDESFELRGEAAVVGESQAPDALLERCERLKAVGELPERQQRLVWLHALGLNYVEIAMYSGCTTRTVERQLLRARRTLRATAA
jgi:RNA polymerase sigma factor (sigma-70 family)